MVFGARVGAFQLAADRSHQVQGTDDQYPTVRFRGLNRSLEGFQGLVMDLGLEIKLACFVRELDRIAVQAALYRGAMDPIDRAGKRLEDPWGILVLSQAQYNLRRPIGQTIRSALLQNSMDTGGHMGPI